MAARPICSIPNCDKPKWGRDLCRSHLRRFNLYGHPLGEPRPYVCGICEIDGCCKPRKSKGLCDAHYAKLLKYGDPTVSFRSRGEAVPFLLAHLRYEADDCVFWPFARTAKGYPVVWYNGRQSGAHRIMCELAHGHPPDDRHHAAHSCGKGHHGCINPNHLSWKTPSENAADKDIHGTNTKGERNPMTVLSEQSVREIREMSGHLTQGEIAEAYGISQALVSLVQRRRLWADVA